ncbi:MAG TPA: hypothetical protein VM243_04090 [Phycisphaerae bacterium]|nr:hypothetical protein [Phycisphaerae bacterium]
MAVTYSGTVPAPWIAQAVFQFNPMNQRFQAFNMARPILVREQTGTMANIDRARTLPSLPTLIRSPGSAYKRGGITVSGTAYKCEGYGYEHQIPKEHEGMYRSLMQAQIVAGQTVLGELYTGLESRMAALLCSTTVWTGSALTTDCHAAPWDTAGSDVIGQVAAAKEKVRLGTGLEPNALITSYDQIENLKMKNTAIRALLSGIVVATPEDMSRFLAPILGLKYIIPVGAVYNSGNEGDAAPTLAQVWNQDYAMVCRVAETDDPSEPCVARTLIWEAMGPGTAAQFGVYSENQTKSTVVQGDLFIDELVVDKYCGHLLEIDPTS